MTYRVVLKFDEENKKGLNKDQIKSLVRQVFEYSPVYDETHPDSLVYEMENCRNALKIFTTFCNNSRHGWITEK